jgi:hypothetical protein
MEKVSKKGILACAMAGGVHAGFRGQSIADRMIPELEGSSAEKGEPGEARAHVPSLREGPRHPESIDGAKVAKDFSECPDAPSQPAPRRSSGCPERDDHGLGIARMMCLTRGAQEVQPTVALGDAHGEPPLVGGLFGLSARIGA